MGRDSRRDFIKRSALATAGAMILTSPGFSIHKLFLDGEYKHIPLQYGYDALEPVIDKKTMEIHHGKHHLAYVNNLNKAILDHKLTGTDFETLLSNISKYPAAIRNNAGGHYNHTLFWSMMRPPLQDKENVPVGKIAETMKKTFGSFDEFKKAFSEKAKSVFGSGWAWLVLTKENKLELGTTANQDNPVMGDSTFRGEPLLCLDVWEHAYYLKYQNKRADYIDAWWKVVNWQEVERVYLSLVK